MASTSPSTSWREPTLPASSPRSVGLAAGAFEPPEDPSDAARWMASLLGDLRKPDARARLLDPERVRGSAIEAWTESQAELVGEALDRGCSASAGALHQFTEFMAAILDRLPETRLVAFLRGLAAGGGRVRQLATAYLARGARPERVARLVPPARQLLLEGQAAPAVEASRRILEACARAGSEEAFDLLDEQAHRYPGEPSVLEHLLAAGLGVIESDAETQARANVTVALFDSLAKLGRLDLTDRALGRLAKRPLPNEILVAVLSATKPSRDREARARFLESATRTLRNTVPERADELLRFVG